MWEGNDSDSPNWHRVGVGDPMVTTAVVGVGFEEERDVLAADEDLFADGHAVKEGLRCVRDLIFSWEGAVVVGKVHWTLEDYFDIGNRHFEGFKVKGAGSI